MASKLEIKCTDLAAEVDGLKHDIGRYLGINSELATENAALTKRIERLEDLLRQAIAATEEANAAVILQSVRTGVPYEGPVFNVTEAKQALEDK